MRVLSLRAGVPEEDTMLSFRVPSSDLTKVVFRAIDVVYGTHTWSQSQAALPYKPVAPDAAMVRRQIAAGQWSIAGTGSLDGRRAIKLTWRDSPWSVSDLWVDADTYLPIEKVVTDMVGAPNDQRTSVTTDQYTYLPPTAASLAKLRVSVPPGFTRTTQQELPPAPGGGKG
jgi:hypothetical protein